MLFMMGPMVLGLAVFQINALLDSLIAFFFAPAEGALAGQVTLLGQTFTAPLMRGDVAALQWSQRLYQFPLGVFGIAIATAIFPALSAAAAKNTNSAADPRLHVADDEFVRILRHGLRLTVFIGLPATVGLLLVRVPLARVIYERGAFEASDSMRVATILAGYASSVWAYSMMHTITRAFYALKDSTTPLKISTAMVSLNLCLNLTLIWPLGAAGLAWSTAISAAGQVVLLLIFIRKRAPRPIDAGVRRSWARSLAASVLMAALLAPVLWLVDLQNASLLTCLGALTGMVLAGAGIVLGFCALTGAEELGWLRRRSVR